MAYQCDICQKKTMAGRSKTHRPGVAGGQWKKRAPASLRVFKPNLHRVTVDIDGKPTKVRACAKCLKRLRFDRMKKEEAVQRATAAV